MSSEILRAVLVFIPISFIGLWRWSFWLLRISAAKMYRPNRRSWPKDRPKPTVTLITPVYNEDPEIFEQAMQSWISNGVDEIIAVIDKSNTHHIIDFAKRYSPRKDVRCRLLVTPKPGKRAALCDGIARATGDLVVLVDSDTIWSENVLSKTLPYFLNDSVGGATVQQRILNPRTTGDILFDLLLWTRYREEVPFLLSFGKVINTLSGRTAFYRRKALVNDHVDNIHNLRHEFFFKTRGVSGDDKRLTHLILEQDWHTAYVPDAVVYTPGLGSLRKFLKQRLRWTRNSWRADLRAVKRRWVFRHPALAVFMIDRFIQPFIMLLGPVACAIAIIAQDWLAAGILLTWWFFSRFVRTFSYFKAYPKRIVYLPAYILYTYVNAIIKIYALATTIENSWATRWDKKRLQKGKKAFRRAMPMIVGSTAVLLFLTLPYNFVLTLHEQSGVSIPVPQNVTNEEFNGRLDFASNARPVPPAPQAMVLPTGVKQYVVQPGDTLASLSQEFGLNIVEFKKLNGIRDPDRISAGQVLVYY